MGGHDLRELPRDNSRCEWTSTGGRCEGRRSLVLPGGPAPFFAGPGARRRRVRACFRNGESSEFNTLLVTDWIAHTPPEVLAKNFGVPAEAFKNIPLHNRWIYQSKIPAPPLSAVESQIAAAAGKPPN